MARLSISDKTSLDMFNKRVKYKNNQYFWTVTELQSKNLLDQKRISFSLSFINDTNIAKINFIKNYTTVISKLKESQYNPLFDVVRNNVIKRKTFQKCFKSLIKELQFNREVLDFKVWFREVNDSNNYHSNPLLHHKSPLLAYSMEFLEDRFIHYCGNLFKKLTSKNYEEIKLHILTHGHPSIKTGKFAVNGKPIFKHINLYSDFRNSLNDQDRKTLKSRVDQFGQYHRAISSLRNHLQTNQICDFKSTVYPKIIKIWLQKIPNKDQSIRQFSAYKSAAFKFFDYLLMNEYYTFANPVNIKKFSDITIPKPKKKFPIIPPKELMNIVQYLKDRKNIEGRWAKERCEIYFSFLTQLTLGLRGGEITKVTLIQKPESHPIISILGTKTAAAERVVQPIYPTVEKILTDHKEYLTCDAHRISQYLQRQKFFKDLNIHITSHTLRRTYITYELFTNQGNLEETYLRLKSETGHTTTEMTDLYNKGLQLINSEYNIHYIKNVWAWIKFECLFQTANDKLYDRNNYYQHLEATHIPKQSRPLPWVSGLANELPPKKKKLVL